MKMMTERTTILVADTGGEDPEKELRVRLRPRITLSHAGGTVTAALTGHPNVSASAGDYAEAIVRLLTEQLGFTVDHQGIGAPDGGSFHRARWWSNG